MILIRNLKLKPGEDEKKLRLLASRALKLRESDIKELVLVRKSLDARKKDSIKWLYSVAVRIKGNEKNALLRAGADCAEYTPFTYKIPQVSAGQRPLVVGFGPAGMFAALVLARAGLRPIVLERGCDADTRRASVDRFWRTGELDTESNVQFGEGGAGMFSDGKLNTGTNDERIAWVLRQLHEHGAPESICYDAKPHVGTDILSGVVKSIRQTIVSLGGEVRFGSKLEGLVISGGKMTGAVAISGEGNETLACAELILAVGHSARDTLEMLEKAGVAMCRKPFSMGVRIEHRQSDVDIAQYGCLDDKLPPADYKLNCRFEDGESAYTFCMCPGGFVVAAASEEGGVVTNGMSLSDRGGENANSALLVTLNPEDFPGDGALAGMRWQREIEQRAYRFGGESYLAPAQTVGDFLENRPSVGGKGIIPSYRPGVVWGELREVLPQKISDTLERALPELGRRMKCFASPDAVMTAPETRSSSPVRILRSESLSSDIAGLYPCGEGAGYAGGITSAAVDGMRCAEAVIAKYIK